MILTPLLTRSSHLLLSTSKLKIIAFFIAFVFCNIQHTNAISFNDSSNRKFRLHLMLSTNPLFQLSPELKSSGLFYSGIPYEAQLSYKKHYLGLGFFRNNKIDNKDVNGIKNINDILRHKFNISYSFEALNNNKWIGLTGASFYFLNADTLKVMYTPLENPSKQYVEREMGIGAFFRFGYQFHKNVSVFIESQMYLNNVKYTYEEVYPLTPSQNKKGEHTEKKLKLFIPSNLFLRISL